MAGLKAEGVGKRYGSVAVMRDLSLEIEDGEFVVLVGPSGCGKSTFLRMIAGLEAISEGTISIGGRVVNDVPPKDRDIAMVFQNYALYPHMTIADNMSFALKMAGVPKAERDEKVRRAAGILGLGDLLGRYPRELSGGQRQRVAMGRAITRDPEVFLFDEPLSNLDAKLRVQVRSEIRELHRRLGTTIVYVTHDQIEAMTMADRIVVMNGGKIEQVGTPSDVYDTPANLFVAQFIGSPGMNILRLEPGRDEAGLRLEGARIAVPILPRLVAGSGRSSVLGVRPESVVLGSEGLPGRVRSVEPTGSETIVTLDSGGQLVTSLVRDRRRIAIGDEVRVRFEPAGSHLFEVESGRRLA